MFSTNFENVFTEGEFGIEQSDCSGSSVSALPTLQVKKLVEKLRVNIRQLGMHLKVHEPAKQLNIILPPPQLVEVTPPATFKDILTVPTVPRRHKRIRKKLSFGVMSDVEIVNSVETDIQQDNDEQIQSENDQILNLERSNDINLLEQAINDEQVTIKAKREQLKQLKAVRAAERKELLERKAAALLEKKNTDSKQYKPQSKRAKKK